QSAVASCVEMQQCIADTGRIDTGSGTVRLKMSVGVHTGTFDVFVVGSSHDELVIAGPATTATVLAEAAAQAGQILVSNATAARLPTTVLGAERPLGRLVRAAPEVDVVTLPPKDSANAE